MRYGMPPVCRWLHPRRAARQKYVDNLIISCDLSLTSHILINAGSSAWLAGRFCVGIKVRLRHPAERLEPRRCSIGSLLNVLTTLRVFGSRLFGNVAKVTADRPKIALSRRQLGKLG